MPSDHVGYDMVAVEHAVSTLMNVIYPLSLLTALMEDLWIYEKIHFPTHLTSHSYFLQAQESVKVSHLDVDICSLQPAITNKCKASTQVRYF